MLLGPLECFFHVLIQPLHLPSPSIPTPSRHTKFCFQHLYSIRCLFTPAGPDSARSSGRPDATRVRELGAARWSWALPDGQAVPLGVSCGGAAARFSCSSKPGRPGWQGLGGEVAQHFSYCYVSGPGRRTGCGGQRRVWVPLVASVWSPVFTSHRGRTGGQSGLSLAWYPLSVCVLLGFFSVSAPPAAAAL